MATRRTLLITGGASVLVGGLGYAGYRHLIGDLSVARAPWREAGTGFGDKRLNALSYAVLAPSPHNRQPWLIDLEGDNDLTLYVDRNRLLAATDPENRQIIIGLGCFMELLRQAAAEDGYALQMDLFPDGAKTVALDDRPIAHATFVRDETIKPDPLFPFVLERRTTRTPFDQNKPVSTDVLEALGLAVRPEDGELHSTIYRDDIALLKDICKDAWRIETTTEATHAESTALTRIGANEINANPDGISLSGPVIESMRLAGVFTRDKMNDPNSTASREIVAFYEKAIDSAMAFCWLTTNGNTRREQIAAGAGWVRAHLEATRLGVAFHPLSQALQEFPEMFMEYENIHIFAAERRNDGTRPRVQGLFRVGYAKAPPAAPRWPMKSRIVAEAV